MKLPKAIAAAMLLALTVTAAAAPAAAHDPIFFEDSQTTPDTGPYMPDGTISWALYGTVLDQGDTRGFEFDLRAGEELYVSLLIPNLEPELSLSDDELPILELEYPSGETETIVPTIRDIFDEPFSQTSYVTLAELRQPAEAGRYRGVVVGNAPSRFTVAVGEREIFFTETERSGDRPSSFPEISGPLTAWYATAPGEEPVEVEEGDGEIQMDLIDEAMESGEAVDPTADTEADQEAADQDETAAVAADADDDGGGLGLIAPLVLVAVLAAGAFFFTQRRRSESKA